MGQLNDPSYKQDPKKAGDSRYLHGDASPDVGRGGTENKDSIPGRLFDGLRRLEEFRSQEAVMARMPVPCSGNRKSSYSLSSAGKRRTEVDGSV